MLWSLFIFLFLPWHSALAKLVTTIIDDAFPGDTLSSISYSPSDAWGIGSAAGHGRVAPDASQALDGTWHDTTDDTTPDHDGTTPTFMEVNFQGTGIDVRCIVANNKADPSIPPFTGTKSNYSFFIDTVPQNRDFTHEAGTTGNAFLYNTSVFSTNELSNGPHTLKLLLNGGPQVDGSVLLLFDYAIVTSDDGTGDSGSGSTDGGATPTSVAVPPAPTSVAVPPTSTPATISAPGTGFKSSSTSFSSQSKTVAGSTTATSGATTQSLGPTIIPSTQPAPTPSSSSSAVPSPASHRFNVGAIIGGLVGGLLALVLLLLLCLRRHRSHRLRIPKILPLPYVIPFFRPHSGGPDQVGADPPPSLPSSLQRKRPAPPASSSVGTSASESSSDPAMRDYVQRLRAEVELLREQQREMVAMQPISSPLDPPPSYAET
ncbi:hypothetical protein B0H19DRAFT_562183 [Mycena capillaripes]|nr:hypothetical protein B0H19DRAFT_562183 [Mycena capillaripes]